MKYIKLFEELTGTFKDETTIIYKDKDLVCMIPKSQMSSRLYGQGTNWCQTHKIGFDNWSKGAGRGDVALLIRFLFKTGRKIKVTYFANGEYFWSREDANHVLYNRGNPFEAKSIRGQWKSSIEEDILSLIKTIPDLCKRDVCRFIDANIKKFKYIYRDEDFKTNKELRTKEGNLPKQSPSGYYVGGQWHNLS